MLIEKLSKNRYVVLGRIDGEIKKMFIYGCPKKDIPKAFVEYFEEQKKRGSSMSPRGYDKDGNPLGGHPNAGRKRKGPEDKAVQIILTVPPSVKKLYDEAEPKARKAARKVAALAMKDILSKNRLTDQDN